LQDKREGGRKGLYRLRPGLHHFVHQRSSNDPFSKPHLSGTYPFDVSIVMTFWCC
jgi:hypothetical protein